MTATWQTVKQNVQKLIPDNAYRMWIDPIELVGVDGQIIQLSCPNTYTARRLTDKYLPLLSQEFSKIGQGSVRIRFMVQSKDPSGDFRHAPARLPATKKPCQLPLPGLDIRFKSGRFFNKGFSFDDFVVGENSDFAYSASQALAKGQRPGNGVLYLLGKTGLGKSHLSQAVGHHIITNGLSDKVYYITAEDFTNEMIYSIKSGCIDQFKEKYRQQCDFLILEDVHFLSGKEATQKELSLTFDYLLNAEKKIIFSGSHVPDDIPKLNNELRSRLSMGLITEIKTPDFDTRIRILKKKVQRFGYQISLPILEYIAQELSNDVRQLESGLYGVAAKSFLLSREIDMALARGVVATLNTGRKNITIESIKQMISQEFSVSEKDLMSTSRKQRIVRPRQLAIYFARKYTDNSIKSIARAFNKYHATVIYSINTIEREIRSKGLLFEQVKFLSKKIGGI